MAKKTKSHTPYGKLVDSINASAQAEAEMGHHPQDTVSPRVPFPFVDGRDVQEQATPPVGNKHPDVMDLAKSTKRRVKPWGKEGGTIAGKKGDRVNPSGDQDDEENGSVHPDQRVPVNSTAWHDVVRDNLAKRKKAEGRDSGEGTNESLDEDERRQIIEEVEELIAAKEPSVIAEEVVGMVEMIESLQADYDYLKKERDDLMDETLHQQLLLHVADFTKSMSLSQAQKFLDRAIDCVDMVKMSTDATYLARTLAQIKESVVREDRRPPQPSSLTEGFANLHDPLGEHVAPMSNAGMRAVQDALKIFRK